LLLGASPKDYDVATDATPKQVANLFRFTRHVGAAFGVMLVREAGAWHEVATFRADGPYLDGRRPSQVHFTDARQDALRRDFTVNGMFLDPLTRQIIDYVGGQVDLAQRCIRAIGVAADRFAEDYLRVLRAVRFAARLGFDIEPATIAALRNNAPNLATVSAERVREELDKMLSHPTRGRAVRLLRYGGVMPHLWPAAEWGESSLDHGVELLEKLPRDSAFATALAALLHDRERSALERIARKLTLSNDERDALLWLVSQQSSLDDAGAMSLAAFKRAMAHRFFPELRMFVDARFALMPDGVDRARVIEHRVAAIDPARVAPPAWVTGEDLIGRGLSPGPAFREILDEVYTRQLDERIHSRDEALQLVDDLIRIRAHRGDHA
ncbi:MAG: CCA tRNA nucleotidyltransferase, partial [Phycisphaerales bacterium]|nr:CCA tRNA nucleotidyltransferase [Phycisphaerales bacterium]